MDRTDTMESPARPPHLEEASSPELFRRLGHALIDQLADYLSAAQRGELPQTLPWADPEDSLKFWSQRVTGQDLTQLVADTLARSVSLHHPKFVGHQVNPPLPVSCLASLVVDVLNNGMGVYEMGMAGTAMERLVVRQVADRLHMPSTSGGFLTSGGSLANLTALLAARARLSEENVWQRGTTRPLVVMVSDAAHYCVDRAVRIMGLGSAGIYRIPVDDRFQMQTDRLAPAQREIEQGGARVLAVVANAGSTATGSYDPLEAIADYCQSQGIWLHVDGAHGAAVCFSRTHQHRVRGIERADSVTLDFHKLLLTPAITSALLFRRDQDSYRTFAQQADYLFADTSHEEWYNLARRTFECTKHMMCLKIFAILACHGPDLLEAHVDHVFELARRFAELIRQRPEMELATDPQANIVCFRYRPPGCDEQQLGAINARIRDEIVRAGEFYFVQTSLLGSTWLRATLSNSRTTVDTLSAMLDRITSTAEQVLGKAP